jgi:hypothetical protein
MVKAFDGVIFIPFLLVGDAKASAATDAGGKIGAFGRDCQCPPTRRMKKDGKRLLDFRLDSEI